MNEHFFPPCTNEIQHTPYNTTDRGVVRGFDSRFISFVERVFFRSSDMRYEDVAPRIFASGIVSGETRLARTPGSRTRQTVPSLGIAVLSAARYNRREFDGTISLRNNPFSLCSSCSLVLLAQFNINVLIGKFLSGRESRCDAC